MIVKLPFARETVALDLRGLRIRPLRPNAPSGGSDSRGMIANAIDQPIAGDPLEALAGGRRSATIVVPDATRRIHLAEILPVLLDRLRRGGIEEANTTILVACGTHPRTGARGLDGLTGPLPADISILQHESRSTHHLVEVGELRPGVPLRLHRAAVEADLLITVGTVRHHYFAGFGGGPKMVFPGVAGHEEIQANHSLVLAAVEAGRFVRHPGCEPGRLHGNPVAEEIARAAETHPPDMAVCLVEGAEGETAWAGAGPWRRAWDAAVERTRSWYEVGGDHRFDVVVASGGGAPADATLIQAHKGLDAACRFLRPGGQLLYVAAIDDGVGSDAMLPYLDHPDPVAIIESLSRQWVQYGHTTLRLLEKTSDFRVMLYSRLDRDLAKRLGFEPVDAVQTVVNTWRENCPGTTVGVMASGAVYPRS